MPSFAHSPKTLSPGMESAIPNLSFDTSDLFNFWKSLTASSAERFFKGSKSEPNSEVSFTKKLYFFSLLSGFPFSIVDSVVSETAGASCF